MPTTYIFDRDEVLLGRSSKCDVVLDPVFDSTVSRRHAAIRRNGALWFASDLQSSHGTFVNDILVDRAVVPLKPRDAVRLGPGGPVLRVSYECPGGAEESSAIIRQPFLGQFPLALYRDFPKRYQVFQKIGEGGYGQVWRARAHGSKKWVAIKFLRPELLQATDSTAAQRGINRLVQRFQREADLMGRLAQSGAEGVVPVREVGGDPEESFLYMILDYISGESLDRSLARHEKLPQAAIVRYLLQVAETLDQAHSIQWRDPESGRELRGIVHRDVKPSNIIVRKRDNRAMLCDFGIAAVEEGWERLTAPNLRVLSFKYAAPEALSQNKITPATDLWGLAVTGYVLLSGGTFPYGGMSMPETLRAIHQRRLMPLSKYCADVHPNLDDFLRKALDPDPRVRPASSREWIQHLS